MLKIETSRGVLDLSNDLSLQIEEKSPVMNERGSQSLPATVPSTPHNMLIMGFPHRLDGVDVPMCDDKSCVVNDGVYHRRGVMNLVSASRKEGITFNVGFDNSEAYEAWKKRKLNELTLPVEGDGNVDHLRTKLQTAYNAGGGVDFAVFPVAVEREEISSDNNVTTVYWGLLNRVENGTLISDQRSQQQPVNGTMTNVSLPNGYGVTPFLYVWRVLELAFSDLGYEIESNPFKGAAAGDLAKVVVLNNTADAICTGYLKYSDLLPDCEVQAFLRALYVRFGLVYLLNQDTRRVKLELIRDIITKDPSLDLTDVQSEWPMVNYEDGKQIKLSAKKSFEGAEPVNERLEDFFEGQQLTGAVSVDVFNDTAHSTALVHERMTGKIYRWDRENSDFNNSVYVYGDSMSGWWNWDRQTEGVDTEDLTSEDECVPMVKVDGTWTPGYLAGAAHRHSYIKGQDSSKEKNETPLSFVISCGQYGRISPTTADTGLTLSLLFQYDNGLFAQFWSAYDNILRHAFTKVESTMRLSHVKLLNLELLTPVRLQAQPLLIDGFSYMLPTKAATEVDMTLRTLRTVGSENIVAEQGIPGFEVGHPTWKWVLDHHDLEEQLAIAERLAAREYGALAEGTTIDREPVDGLTWINDNYWNAELHPVPEQLTTATKVYQVDATIEITYDGHIVGTETVRVDYTVTMKTVLS